MKKTHGIDEYLEAIYVLQNEGYEVIGSQLADYLSVSRPTVSQTLQRLISASLVQDTGERAITLTKEGITRAEAVIRRHRLIERWLTDVLGLDWAESHEEASRLEHAISDRVEKRLAKVLGFPTTCPHGNVIPGAGILSEKAMPLSKMNVPSTVAVQRIFEHAEEDPDILRYLEKNRIVPGTTMQLLSSSPAERVLTIQIEDNQLQVPSDIADRVLVTAASDE